MGTFWPQNVQLERGLSLTWPPCIWLYSIYVFKKTIHQILYVVRNDVYHEKRKKLKRATYVLVRIVLIRMKRVLKSLKSYMFGMSLKSFHIHDQKHIDSLSPFFVTRNSEICHSYLARRASRVEIVHILIYMLIYTYICLNTVESTFHAEKSHGYKI